MPTFEGIIKEIADILFRQNGYDVPKYIRPPSNYASLSSAMPLDKCTTEEARGPRTDDDLNRGLNI